MSNAPHFASRECIFVGGGAPIRCRSLEGVLVVPRSESAAFGVLRDERVEKIYSLKQGVGEEPGQLVKQIARLPRAREICEHRNISRNVVAAIGVSIGDSDVM